MRLIKHPIFFKLNAFFIGFLSFTKTRRAKSIGIAALVFFALFSITGFFVLPPFIKHLAMEKLSGQLGRRVSIDTVILNPYSLAASIRGFEIKEADGRTTFISFRSLYINLNVKTIFKGGPVMKEIKLDKPYVHLVRTGSNAYNFSDIASKLEAEREAAIPEKPGKPLFFSLSNIQLVDGKIEFDDRPAATKHEITQINLSIPFISNFPSYVETFVQPSFSATVNGTPLNVRGTTKVFSDSHETSFDIALKDIDIPYYLAYAPTHLNVKVPSGRLDVAMKLAYRQYKDRSPMLTLTGESRVRDLSVAIKKVRGEFLKVPLFSIKDISFDLETNKVEIGAIATEKGSLAVSRSADGRMNFSSLMTASTAASRPTTKKSAKSAPPSALWILSLKSLNVDGYKVKIEDQSLNEPFGVTVDDISCKAQNISTEKGSKGAIALSMHIGPQGAAAAEGDFALNPPSADLVVSLKRLPIKPLQPFLAERAQVIVAAGALSMNGKLTAFQASKEELKAAFTGKLSVNRFSLLDKVNAEDLLKWDSLYLGGMDIRYAPLFLHIREIALSNFYSRIIINSDRTINLQEVFSSPTLTAKEAAPSDLAPQTTEAAAESPQEQRQQLKLAIDKITLQGGTINFTDNSIKPRFSADLLEIGGRISGLSSDENKFGDVELRGKYDRYAPLEITGKINPIRDNLYVELKANFKDMDLTAVSPYSGRYAGYTVQKGKLSFQLEYLIVKNKLDAKNNIFIDQFNFGDPINSPDATKLPVRLAVALLKDQNGEIKLQIPVSGDLKDPKFSVGKVVLKIIVNLLVKVATSPFALLGSIFGGGEQLGYAEFDYGSAALTAETQKKLDILTKALHDRPALKMDIIGHADPEKDREGLKQNLLLRRVKSQKVKDMARKGGETPSLDDVIVTPQEYPIYLKQAYKAEKFPKPRNILGMAKDLPVPEMEKLMLTNLTVTDDDLKALCEERARAVRNYLLQSQQVAEERIFIVESNDLDAKKNKEGAKNSRTDFKLK
jgi:flagellar motor protein MotB